MPIAAGGTRKAGDTASAPAARPASLATRSARRRLLVEASPAKLIQCASQNAHTPIDVAAIPSAALTFASGGSARPARPPNPKLMRAIAPFSGLLRWALGR